MGRVANAALASAWKRRIASQRRSQLSITEFCSREGVSPKSFYAWRRRLREDEATALPSSLFVPVEVSSPSAGASGVRIEFPGGAVLTLPADASGELVIAAIRAVLPATSAQERPAC